jgi:hypothetical protein
MANRHVDNRSPLLSHEHFHSLQKKNLIIFHVKRTSHPPLLIPNPSLRTLSQRSKQTRINIYTEKAVKVVYKM